MNTNPYQLVNLMRDVHGYLQVGEWNGRNWIYIAKFKNLEDAMEYCEFKNKQVKDVCTPAMAGVSLE